MPGWTAVLDISCSRGYSYSLDVGWDPPTRSADCAGTGHPSMTLDRRVWASMMIGRMETTMWRHTWQIICRIYRKRTIAPITVCMVGILHHEKSLDMKIRTLVKSLNSFSFPRIFISTFQLLTNEKQPVDIVMHFLSSVLLICLHEDTQTALGHLSLSKSVVHIG